MPHASVNVGEETFNTLRELAQRTGQPVEAILDQAVEIYRRQRFLEDSNAAFGKLRNDAAAWQDEQLEREAWDATLADGLEETTEI